MPVTDVRTDTDALTMHLDAEFEATPERVWELWADPRQLERWWGPPTYPATVTSHDLRPGGHVAYHMTGPEGDQVHAWFEVEEVSPPHGLVAREGFARADGSPDQDMPVNQLRVTIDELSEGRSRMTIQSVFPDLEAMEQLLAMGMHEGMREAVGQVDAILAEDVPAGHAG